MKKAVSALGAFCFGAFITIGVMACADDYSEANPIMQNGSKVCVVEVRNTYGVSAYNDFNFVYDEAGRIVQGKSAIYVNGESASYAFDVTYTNNVVTISYRTPHVTTIKFAKDVAYYPIESVNGYIIEDVKNNALSDTILPY